jgi:hypothetical protein
MKVRKSAKEIKKTITEEKTYNMSIESSKSTSKIERRRN